MQNGPCESKLLMVKNIFIIPSKAKKASFLSSYAKKGPLFCHGYCTKYHLSTLE
jgi:hypothetical protein